MKYACLSGNIFARLGFWSAAQAIGVAALWLLSVAGLHAAIEYVSALDAYVVTEFPAGWPCTPERLADMDRLLGLGKMSRAAETGAWTLDCHLVIGANDGTETYFQIGAPDHRTNETLILRGSLYVTPYHVAGESPYQHWWYGPAHVNRLSLGGAEYPEVHAALLFAASERGEVGSLVIGARREADGRVTRGRGGQFMAWNGLVSAADAAPGREIAGVSLAGADGFVFLNSTLARVKGMMTYGLNAGWRINVRIEDSVFAHGGQVIIGGGPLIFRNCRFHDNDTVVLDYGGMDVTLDGCIFENNRCNWALRFPGKTPGTLALIDCDIGAPRAGNQMEVSASHLAAMRDKGESPQMPQALIKRHVVARAMDAEGRPVLKAMVAVRAEQPGCDMDEGMRFVTGADGRTPARGERGAILLMAEKQVVAEEHPSGVINTWTYTINAENDAGRGMVAGFAPARKGGEVSVVINQPGN